MTGGNGTAPTQVAIIGSGNIATDLMIKIIRSSGRLRVAAVAGIDPASDGLARARHLGVATTADGVDGLVAMPEFGDVRIVFDATSAAAHLRHHEVLTALGRRVVDLTPAAIGPYVVPAVNADAHREAVDVNMVTCGGQATIPVVAAVARVAPVAYAEIVASIASRSAGPGTRANIDEFVRTTAAAVEQVGGADRGKAIIVLNPAEPPLPMRNTVLCLTEELDDVTQDAVRRSVEEMVASVAGYVPGYRLKQRVQFERLPAAAVDGFVAAGGPARARHQVTAFLEVVGAAHHLPAYAGNLDIMTSAALRAGEQLAAAGPAAAGAGRAAS